MNDEKFTQLRLLAYNNIEHAVDAKVEKDPRLATMGCDRYNQTLLHTACIGRNITNVQDLVKRKANVKQRDIFGCDALMYASISGCTHIIEFLLSRGADMTARDNIGSTALGCAAMYNELSACKFLISRGSDLMAKNKHGMTALDLYGKNCSLIKEDREKYCTELRALFAEGPHPSQVQRRADLLALNV